MISISTYSNLSYDFQVVMCKFIPEMHIVVWESCVNASGRRHPAVELVYATTLIISHNSVKPQKLSG